MLCQLPKPSRLYVLLVVRAGQGDGRGDACSASGEHAPLILHQAVHRIIAGYKAAAALGVQGPLIELIAEGS